MPKHLGRNPFEKAKTGANKGRPIYSDHNRSSPIEWLLIQLPAKAFMFAIKTGALLKHTFEKKL